MTHSMTHRRTQELKKLLSPLPEPPDQAQAKVIGKQYMAKRLQLELLISEAADRSGLAQFVIRDIEQIRELRVATASLQDYLRYADTLSCSLQEVTDFDPTLPLLIPLSQVFNLVEVAIQQLEKQGEPLTRRNIRNLVGMEVASLWDSPRMVRLLAKRPKGRIQQSQAEKIEREEEVIKLVEQAIEQLKARGVRVSQQRIADLVGMTRSALMAYPRVKARLEQLAERLSPLDLQRVVQDDVEQAQALGTSLAYWSVGERISIPKETLRSDSQIRAIIDRAQNEARQRRENELVNRVEHAIEELVSQGKKVTVHKVSRLVGVDHKALDRRPHIRELFLVLR
jgi:transcriptional regulator with XRE-family HTH domain